MDLRPGREMISADIPDEVLADFSCSRYLDAGGAFPLMLVARAGKDNQFINHSIETFVAAAVAAGVEIEYLNHGKGQHAFDVRDGEAPAPAIIQRPPDSLGNAVRVYLR